MASDMKGHVELDAAILTRVTDFTVTSGMEKEKIFPAGKTLAQDTSYGQRKISGTLVIYGTDENGWEFDWRTACNTKLKFNMVRHYSATERVGYREVEFSTNDSNLPSGTEPSTITLNWIAAEDYAA